MSVSDTVPDRFAFSRKGDCERCHGTGVIYRYLPNDGRCFGCKGTGGKRPPKGAYRVFLVAAGHELGRANASASIGLVRKVKSRWMPGRCKTREAAADCLLEQRRHQLLVPEARR